MNAKTVYFTPWEASSNMLVKVREMYEEARLFDGVEKGDMVAVKLHVGELGNPNYVRPFFVKQIIDLLKDRGAKPFLTDTTTYYPVLRANAYDHMETAVTNGFGFAPFIVADGLKGEHGIPVASADPALLKEVKVAGAVHQADAMVVISHFKGHALAGFGAAIKNLAMGCVSKASKLAQHRLVDIEVDHELCQGCGTCTEACWFGLPRIENDKAILDDQRCMRCPICGAACPEGAISLKNIENLGRGLGIAAKAVLDTFDESKLAFINFAVDISYQCDCVPFPAGAMAQDLGVFAGFSPLSVDSACIKQIDSDHLKEVHGVDCWTQIHSLAKLDTAGSVDPELVEV